MEDTDADRANHTAWLDVDKRARTRRARVNRGPTTSKLWSIVVTSSMTRLGSHHSVVDLCADRDIDVRDRVS